MQDFLERIFWIETQIQLKHWQEEGGYKHEQLGNFYQSITKSFDRLVECYIGDKDNIVPLISESLYKITNHIDIDSLITEIRKFVFLLKKDKELQSPALQNIIDDIATEVEGYNYLLHKN